MRINDGEEFRIKISKRPIEQQKNGNKFYNHRLLNESLRVLSSDNVAFDSVKSREEISLLMLQLHFSNITSKYRKITKFLCIVFI